MSTTETTEKIKGRLVYIGVKIAGGGKPVHCYHEIDEQEKISDKLNLYDTKLSRGAIGSILDVEFSNNKETVHFSKKMIPSGFLKDYKIVSEWRTASEAIETTIKRKKEQVGVSNQNPLKERLEPIKEAYRNASPADRASMLANIIEYITR